MSMGGGGVSLDGNSQLHLSSHFWESPGRDTHFGPVLTSPEQLKETRALFGAWWTRFSRRRSPRL